MKFVRLKKRSEFLFVSRIKKAYHTPHFVFQFRHNEKYEGLRFGITASKKVGSAVVRNRVKRRFRAIISNTLKTFEHNKIPSFDCVIIARSSAYNSNFSDLEKSFEQCLNQLASEPFSSSPLYISLSLK